MYAVRGKFRRCLIINNDLSRKLNVVVLQMLGADRLCIKKPGDLLRTPLILRHLYPKSLPLRSLVGSIQELNS